jgi:PII-like signaling protein
MKGTHLRLYTYENRRHDGALLYEWLLERARSLACTVALRSGRSPASAATVTCMSSTFELAGDVPVLVEFILGESEADSLLDLLRRERSTCSMHGWRPISTSPTPL